MKSLGGKGLNMNRTGEDGGADRSEIRQIEQMINHAIKEDSIEQWREGWTSLYTYLWAKAEIKIGLDFPNILPIHREDLAKLAAVRSLDNAVSNLDRAGKSTPGQLVRLSVDALLGRSLNGKRKIIGELEKLLKRVQRRQWVVLRKSDAKKNGKWFVNDASRGNLTRPEEIVSWKHDYEIAARHLAQISEFPKMGKGQREVVRALAKFIHIRLKDISLTDPSLARITLYFLDKRGLWVLDPEVSEFLQREMNVTQAAAKRRTDRVLPFLVRMEEQYGEDVLGVKEPAEDKTRVKRETSPTLH